MNDTFFMNKVTIVDITKDNISKYPPKCFLNPKNEGYLTKLTWIKNEFSKELKLKQLYVENEKKAVSFIEYISGENAWRAVDAKNYLFIHCLWTSQNKLKNKGYASLLIEECIKEAKDQGLLGVAVVTSEGPFMAGKDLFVKNGFKSVDSAKPSFDLLVKKVSISSWK